MENRATLEQIIKSLHEKTKGMAHLAPSLPFFEALIELEKTTAVPPLPFKFTTDETVTLLENKTPLLQQGRTPIFYEPMAAVWHKVCSISSTQQLSVEEITKLPEKKKGAWLDLMEQYFRDNKVASSGPEENELLTFLLIHTWRPFLIHWAEELASLVNDSVWYQNVCPICGGHPDFIYFSKDIGERHLLCLRCDTDWAYNRIGCPFCGNSDPATYGYYPDEKDTYRLYICNHCNHYLKTLDMRKITGQRLLPVERIITIDMDLAARDGK